MFDNRGNAWQYKGDYDKAIADYDEALRIDPTRATTCHNRGLTWKKKSEFAKAVADFDRALELDPKNNSTYESLAWLRATCPNPEFRDGRKALASATRACEMSASKRAQSLCVLAAAYAEIGDFDNAVETQKKALDIASEDEREYFSEILETYQRRRPYREE